MLAGKDTGKWAFYSEVAGGPGSDGGLSSEITRIDYNGDLDKFSIYSLGGERDKGYGGVEITGEVASIGGAFSWSPNKEIVGCTIQVGLGGSYIPWVYGGFNRGNVTLPIKLRLK